MRRGLRIAASIAAGLVPVVVVAVGMRFGFWAAWLLFFSSFVAVMTYTYPGWTR